MRSFGLYPALVALSLAYRPSVSNNQRDIHVEVVMAEVGQSYQQSVSKVSEYHFVYLIPANLFPQRTIRLESKVLDRGRGSASVAHPIQVAARVNKGITTWQIPFRDADVVYTSMDRTLCLRDDLDNGDAIEAEWDEVTVVISTSSLELIEFEVSMIEDKTFGVSLNHEIELKSVTYSSPTMLYVNLKDLDDDDLLQVKVTSDDDKTCAIVSVQPFTCPFSDTENTIRSEGTYQTMLGVASFNFLKKSFPGDGVFISLILSSTDAVCGEDEQATPARKKDFHFRISNEVTRERIILEVSITTSLLIVMCVTTVAVTLCYDKRERAKNIDKRIRKINDMVETDGSGRDQTSNFSSVEEQDQSISSQHRIPQFVAEIPVQDRVSQAQLKSMFQKSDLYIWLVFMLGIFYGIPAVQLVISYQNKLLQSGNQDLCYYNFLCSIPTASVRDFNHIYSNIWYLGFGVLFVFLTWYRRREHFNFLARWEEETNLDHVDYGLPQHFGLFYAMGFAMIFEGILSACYHVCPTTENFQFDTTFMYLMATLCFMKIYQFRHPDIVSNAYKVFFGLGLVLLLEVFGIFYESVLYWVLLLLGYALICIVLTSILYQSGRWSLDAQIFPKMLRSVKTTVKHRKCILDRRRMILVYLINGMNLLFLILGAIFQPGISSFLLGIFIANLLLYACYYTAMKIIHKETIKVCTSVYFGLALIAWIPAFYFFMGADYSTVASPAQSRNLNSDCLILEIFDHHDIWHMLSAAGLFFCFLVIQTLDDGLFYTPRSQIHVF